MSDQSRREQLELLQVTLLAAIDGASARDLVGLSRELRQVVAELERTAAPAELTAADQIAARRKARRSQPRRTGRVRGDPENSGRTYN